MADFFFYGTLCHRPLLDLVLGHDGAQAEPARLPGHRVVWVEGQSFPIILTDGPGAAGLLVRDLSDRDVARLDFYEGGFGYGTRILRVDTETGEAVGARVYWPDPGHWTAGAPWDLGDWGGRWGALTLDAAGECMDLFGHVTAQEMARLFPAIRGRAWARQLAARKVAPQTVRSERGAAAPDIRDVAGGHHGFFRLRTILASHTRFDGSRTDPVPREVYVGFDAALVLPYDPVRDTVLLVEQFRYGPTLRGDPATRILEPPAGMVDAGEDPADTARREAAEETGLTLTDLIALPGGYAAPGYCTDFFHCFVAICDLDGAGGQTGGHPDEEEDIRTHVLSFDAAMALLDSGEINVAPLAMMLLWLARARDGLRAAHG